MINPEHIRDILPRVLERIRTNYFDEKEKEILKRVDREDREKQNDILSGRIEKGGKK